MANGGSQLLLVDAASENVSVANIGSSAQPRYGIVATLDALAASTYSKGEAEHGNAAFEARRVSSDYARAPRPQRQLPLLEMRRADRRPLQRRG
jgi:hypothetical protein